MKNQGFIDPSLRKNTSGNAFVIVLIMIALIVALTVTITRMSGNGANNMSNDQLDIMASDVLKTMWTMKTAVQRLQQVNGCSENQITFEIVGVTSGYTNPNAPTDLHCHLRAAQGAGMFEGEQEEASLLRSKSEWRDTNPTSVANGAYGDIKISSATCHWKVGAEDATTCDSELDAVVMLISPELCVALNKKLNINPPTFAALSEDMPINSFAGSYVQGTYGAGTAVYGDNTGASPLQRQPAFCIKAVTSGYHFIYTLIPR